jgi:DNA polymerase IV
VPAATRSASRETPSRREWILHVDLDQFLAAVEVLRNPDLRGRPVVVAATDDLTRQRTVVATASYEARAFGIRSGMPMRTARRLCPDAVFLPSDRATYEAASQQVMGALRTFDAVVEVLGWDEAFVGATTDDPEGLAADVRARVSAATGLSCAVGIGDNKLRAKIATGFAKPGGLARLTADDWMDVMGDRPTEALWGIGRKTARKLAELGLTTVAELAGADPATLTERFGPTMGPYYLAIGQGRGSTHVSDEPWVARSHSHEVTFDDDLTDRSRIDAEVERLARRLADEAADAGRTVTRVAVKVRFVPFFTKLRSRTLPEPTTSSDTVAAAALDVLDRFDLERPVRLLGVRVELAPPDAPTDG